MAAYRESMPAQTWLHENASTTGLDDSTLMRLEHTCGEADVGDAIEERLRPEGVDFSTASPEQIRTAVNELLQGGPADAAQAHPGSSAAPAAEDDEEVDVRSLVPEPSYEQLARELVASVYEDSTFADTLRQHLAGVPVSEGDVDAVAEAVAAELAQAVAEGITQAFQDAYGQHGATPPTSEQLYQSLESLGLLS